MATEMGKGCIWRLKYFTLFPPMQAVLARLDHYSRFFFPMAFVILLLASLSEVGFGRAHYARLQPALDRCTSG